ncbi:rhodanese-like domain-containing protein [Alicyclobacillus sp. SO9]|uniref:rhodanese-like domain-containing protein n=1 Tax=Alicyclobacillus sp. SO9 TaxID=2665646 RepID=UPI0018E7328F|nr:rhodanese-like domain-containing protein [Alicyclobacillus sp. SO9]QQE78474.1 rhodanese-like domain-containing protein [Alicyclobacillus sp. SO9]
MISKLSTEELKKFLQANSLDVLDLRSVSEFMAGFILGSINLPSSEKDFFSNLHKIWPHPRNVVFITEEAMVSTDILSFVREVGGTVQGYASYDEWKQAGYTTLTLETIKIDNLLKNRISFEFIDVRTEEEWTKKHVHGSINIPLSKLNWLDQELNIAKKYVAFCAGVYRGIAATAKLRAQGFDVLYLPYGMHAWEDHGGPIDGVQS